MCPADDWDLWICAGARGWRFHHFPRATFDYRVRPGSLISELNPLAREDLLKRVRVKHSELYWAKATRLLEAVKLLIADQTDNDNGLLVKEERMLALLAEFENNVKSLSADLAVERARTATLVIELAQQAEKNEQMIRAREEDMASQKRAG